MAAVDGREAIGRPDPPFVGHDLEGLEPASFAVIEAELGGAAVRQGR